MEQLYALKSPGGLLWKGNWMREDLLAQLRAGKLEDTLLICPIGEAKEAVSLRQFASDPDIFRKRKAKLAEWKRTREEIAKTVEKPWLRKAGARTMQAFVLCLIFVGGTVKIVTALFYPDLADDFPGIAIAVIASVWSIFGIGFVLWIVGWIQHQGRIRERLRSEPPFDPGSA